MRWYFAIDEPGSRSGVGDHAKLAVRSAALAGGLDPVLLYYGNKTDFTSWMETQGVRVIHTEPGFLAAIRAAEAAGTYRPHSIGHWLRLAIPLIEQRDEFVLYTDCDVLFLRAVNWAAIRPRNLAAGPEFGPASWGYFNGGVMVLNVPAMRQGYPALEALIRANIAAPLSFNFDDQVSLNEFYRGQWDRLDPIFNWKPYWGYDRRAAILHFHGPKLGDIEAMAEGRWLRHDAGAALLGNMLDATIDGYIAWCNMLGDALQAVDFAAALRLHRAAAALTRYRPGIGPNVDRSFLNR